MNMLPDDITKPELIDILVFEYNFDRHMLERLVFKDIKQKAVELEVF